ncbi:hypothetical protein ACSNOI_13200 [Actinomadura kijaniata]|uniref:hypothetical protein n=1 Tax=Actinomadura kijaniata TaxID=46161 RepID=UPI003F1C310C
MRAHRVAGVAREALRPDGVNVVHSSGRAARQEVFSLHAQVASRWRAAVRGR